MDTTPQPCNQKQNGHPKPNHYQYQFSMRRDTAVFHSLNKSELKQTCHNLKRAMVPERSTVFPAATKKERSISLDPETEANCNHSGLSKAAEEQDRMVLPQRTRQRCNILRCSPHKSMCYQRRVLLEPECAWWPRTDGRLYLQITHL
jgi:hypothetical protein